MKTELANIYWLVYRGVCLDKVNTIRRVCIVQYVFLFHLAKQINHPDPG